MITYRKADIRDIPQTVSLRLQFLKEVYPQADASRDVLLQEKITAYLQEHLPQGDFVNLFAEDNGVIVASAGIVFYNQPPLYHNLDGQVAYILNVYTLPAYRGQGIARALMERLIIEAKDRNTGKLSLHASKDGRLLYEKLGFLAGDNEMTLQLPRVQP
ncbi:GNAT family N-acetyltransferase [Chitinophaga varians]|uniref:GNAT family N-acetyltransferase n=2 Tax=Chitinophaga TaxID=79328 RepID=A0A847RNN3_9BACT|nr:GNAT family N-acetyltransferase [Chitinophaga varians]NLR64686.1 GNAT family N-acetyltransferase [Chitinophaga varians]